MTVVFQLPEDVAQALSVRAHACGATLPEYVQAVLRRDAFKEEWISLREAQVATGLQRIQLREAIARGHLKAHKSSRLWRVRREELECWAKTRSAPRPPSEPATAQPTEG